MATLVADTHKAIVLLQEKKFSPSQAEGIVEVLNQLDVLHLATKDDMKDLRLDVYKALAAQTVVIIGVVVTLFQFLK